MEIPFIDSLTAQSSFDVTAKQLDKCAPQKLDNLLWSNTGYKPDVTFALAHSNDCIYLRYRVFEDDITAVHLNTNDWVYEDTCVEFFIAIGDDPKYYNIEFNRLGTCFMAYTGGKHDIVTLPEQAINCIKTQSEIIAAGKGFKYGWQLTLIIPTAVFIHHPGLNLNGITCQGNLYKCGDKLSRPHFLSWRNIGVPQPNFHLPEYFEELLFNT